MAFLKSYSEITLLPNLHSNTITLIGQKNFEDYIAVKQSQDAFYALYNELHSDQEKAKQGILQSKLQTWDLITGKLMSD